MFFEEMEKSRKIEGRKKIHTEKKEKKDVRGKQGTNRGHVVNKAIYSCLEDVDMAGLLKVT